MRCHAIPSLNGAGRFVCAMAAMLMLAFVPTARAFDSYLKYIHDDITAVAGMTRGWAESAVTNLQKFNRGVDWDETSQYYKDVSLGIKTVSVPDYLGPNAQYRYFHHFDRGKDGANFRGVTDVFNASRDYILEQITIARDKAATDKTATLQALGRGLHAVQDLNAHSNLIDLSAADQAKVLEATFDNTKPLPAGFLLTSYVTTRETENPAGDPLNYTHGEKAKDNDKKNAESQLVPNGQPKTKYELAYDSGVKFSEMLLAKFEVGLPVADLDGVMQFALLEPHPADAIYQFAVKAPFTPGSPTQIGANGTTVEFGPAAFAESQTVELLGAPLNIIRETSDQFAPDGRFMGLLREIGPIGVSMVEPATVQIEFSLSEVEFLDPATLQVYSFDTTAGSWAYVPGGIISFGGSDALASFSATATGVYAVGGFLVPEPSSLVLAMMAGGLMLRRRRARPRGVA